MGCSMKSPTKNAEGAREPLAGGRVPDVVQTGKDDLSDWLELMEVVEVLCPVWPEREVLEEKGEYKL